MRRMIPNKLIDWVKNIKDKIFHNEETNTTEIGGNVEVDGTLKVSGGEEVITDIQAVIDEGNPQLNLKQGETIVNITDMNPILANGEKIEDVSFNIEDIAITNGVNFSYVSCAKNGKKITFAIAGTFTRNENTTSNSNIGFFSIPKVIGDKLYPDENGYLANLKLTMFSSATTSISIDTVMRKNQYENFDNLSIQFFSIGITPTMGTTYSFRYELTFLLSDNLI